MIRSSRLARWAFGVLAIVAGSASLPASDLYVTGKNYSANTAFFGKIDTSTGVYTQLNANMAGSANVMGLVWNPAISQFNTLTDSGTLMSISTAGVTGSVIATGRSGKTLAYNTSTSLMYELSNTAVYTIDPATGAQSLVGSTGLNAVTGVAFQNGTLYSTQSNSNTSVYFFGSVNLNTGAFSNISTTNLVYGDMLVASTGSTMYGLNGANLYTINPVTGGYTQAATVTGFGGSTYWTAMSAVVTPVPEPSTYALAAIATGLMAALARRRKARQG